MQNLASRGGVLRMDFDRSIGGLLRGVRVVPGREAAKIAALSKEIARIETECAALDTVIGAARHEASREGAREGYREGRAEAVALVADALRFRREVMEAAAGEALDLAFTVASRLIGREIARDPVLLRACVELWREQAGGSAACIVSMSPGDAAAILAAGPLPDGVRISPDDALARGACRIDAGGEVFETGFDVLLDGVRDAVR